MDQSFEEFIQRAWAEHGKQPEQVASRIESGVALVTNGDQAAKLAQLTAHVFGEHLGKWDQGVSYLEQIKRHASLASEKENLNAVDRALAGLQIAGGIKRDISLVSNSDNIRALALAASALGGHQKFLMAKKYFEQASGLANEKLPPKDPAYRALAVTGNNLACALEEMSSLSDEDSSFMIFAANSARQYWEVAGTWLEVERAEYRLSRSYLRAQLLEQALGHAKKCLEMVEKNAAPALEFFFAYEAMALVNHASKNIPEFVVAVNQMKFYFEKLDESDRPWCKQSLDKILRLDQ